MSKFVAKLVGDTGPHHHKHIERIRFAYTQDAALSHPITHINSNSELIQSHMAQKPVLRGEVGCACVARKRDKNLRYTH